MSLIEQAVEVLSKLPPRAVELVITIVKGALASDDPVRHLERRATAEAAHAASQETVRAALRRGAP